MGNNPLTTWQQLFTERELQVISPLLEGKSTKQIALQLGIVTRSVEVHLTHIYEKIDSTTVGMADALYAEYSGETSDTKADLGGSQSNHFKINNLEFKYLPDNLWYQVNTNYMVNILTPHTPYGDSVGFTYPFTWVENWTNH